MAAARSLVVSAAIALSFPAAAVDVAGTQQNSTQATATQPSSLRQTASRATSWSNPGSPKEDADVAAMWGISVDELSRARFLMQGPRGAFSAPNISPLEALGMHAKTDQERRRYAKLFARASIDDTLRVMAWVEAARVESRALSDPLQVAIPPPAPPPARPAAAIKPAVQGRAADNREPRAAPAKGQR
jgi:hypothetical protein